MKTITVSFNDLQWLVGAKKTDGESENNTLYFEVDADDGDGDEEMNMAINYLVVMQQAMYFEILSRVIEFRIKSTQKFGIGHGSELIHLKCAVENEQMANPTYMVKDYRIEFHGAKRIC